MCKWVHDIISADFEKLIFSWFLLQFNSIPAEWLQSPIFSGGLQTSQIHYNYNEEKDEDHCSSLGTTTPDKAKLYSQRITLSDHAQPFLQAIADNNTQDHTVKVTSAKRWSENKQ